MHPAVKTTIQLMQFRAGPQDFPYSMQVTRIVLVLALAVTFLNARLALPTAAAIVNAALSLAVMAGLIWQLLAWRGLANRAQQTINSVFATSTVFTLLLLPMWTAIAPHMVRIAENPDAAPTEPVPGLPLMGVIVLSLWNLGVSANIFRHALNVHPLMGVVVSLACAFVSALFAGSVSSLLVG